MTPIGEQPVATFKRFEDFDAAEIEFPVRLKPAYALVRENYETTIEAGDDRETRRSRYMSAEDRSTVGEVGVFRA